MLLTLVMAALSIQPAQPAPFHAQLDHIVVAIRSLPEGIAAFEKLTGVKPQVGGQHPGRGTENALVSLGGERYLEIIAPQAGAQLSPIDQPMRGLSSLGIIGWAIRVSDAHQAHDRLKNAGITPSPVTPGSRVTPDGARLAWTTFDVLTPTIAVAPFFIEWAQNTKHPSTTSPGGCTFASLSVSDPESASLTRALDALGVSGIDVTNGPSAIHLTLQCPNGKVRLSSPE